MISAPSPARRARGAGHRRLRAAILVTLVWGVAALPFVSGIAYCPTAKFFHVACPGCGMTRALEALLHGDVAASLRFHALAVPTLVAQGALAIASICAAARFGAPWALLRAWWGRAAVGSAAAVLVLDLVLWAARALGAFGGAVPV